MANKVECTCEVCGGSFELYQSQIDRGQGTTCSRECLTIHQTDESTHVEVTCKTCGTTFDAYKHDIENHDRGKYCSKECMYDGREMPSGQDHWKYTGNSNWTSSEAGRAWRKAIFQRDDYTCQDCGEKGGRLNAHHIKRRADCEMRNGIDEAYAIWNGVCLCIECHAERHKGEQVYQLLKSKV